jgi:hypothetical protein
MAKKTAIFSRSTSSITLRLSNQTPKGERGHLQYLYPVVYIYRGVLAAGVAGKNYNRCIRDAHKGGGAA